LIVGILSQIAADHDTNMRARGDGGVMAGVSPGLLTLVGGVPARLPAVLSATMATLDAVSKPRLRIAHGS
jgi:hypothetical protein